MSLNEMDERIARLLGQDSSDDYDDSSEDEKHDAECSNTEQEQSSSDDDLPLSYEDSHTSKDFFVGKDGTVWNKKAPVSSGSERLNAIRDMMPHVYSVTHALKSPVECFNYFINEDMLNIIVENTNKYITKIRPNFARERDAHDTTLTEIKGLIGLLLLCGVKNCSRLDIKDLFNKNGTSMEIVRLVISEHRFCFLLRCLRFDNEETRADRLKLDKLAPIRDFLDIFVENCVQAYSPSAFITIDEMLSPFQGRRKSRQQAQYKPNKYGIKIVAAADSKTFYVTNLEIYLGAQPGNLYRCSNEAMDFVTRLCGPISGSGRNVTTSTRFTSYELTSKLLKDHDLTVMGVIRKNKPQIPTPFCYMKSRKQNSFLFGFQKDMTLLSFLTEKDKNELFISSLHHDNAVDKDSGKPNLILDYNSTKSAVEFLDMLCNVYNCQRKTRRWPMILFYTMLNIATVNAQVIYELNNDTKAIRKTIIESVSYALFEDQLKYRYSCVNISKTIRLRIKEILNLPDEVERAGPSVNRVLGRCQYCGRKKNRKTKYSCIHCGKHMCLEHVIVVCRDCVFNEDFLIDKE